MSIDKKTKKLLESKLRGMRPFGGGARRDDYSDDSNGGNGKHTNGRYGSRTEHLQYLEGLVRSQRSKKQEQSKLRSLTEEEVMKFEKIGGYGDAAAYFRKFTEDEKKLFIGHYPHTYVSRVRPSLEPDEKQMYAKYNLLRRIKKKDSTYKTKK